MRQPNRFISALAAGTMLGSALIATPVAAQRVEVGNAATIVGTVEITDGADGEKREIARRERIAWGDLIETKRRSQLQILLLDRSSFGIGARSSVRIDSFVYDPEAGRSVFATFLKGALRFFSGSQDDDNSGEITTPSGRIGIRGTAVDILVGEEAEKIAEDEEAIGRTRSEKDEATLTILRGPGSGTLGGLTPGLVEVEGAGVTVVLDAPGLAAYIPHAGAAPIGPFRISDSGLSKVQDELAPEVARAAEGGSILNTLIPVAVGAVALGAILSGDGDNANPAGATADSPRAPNTAGTAPSPNSVPTTSSAPPRPVQ
jgi:hypothetical protein